MTHPTPLLLALPTELLDRIATYLDWDRSDSLIPRRPDIHSLTLTSRHLRDTTLPLLFRNVTLTLRWQHGVLLEPTLYRLRRERPDLVRHVRAVYVVTRMGYRPGTVRGEETPDFRVPDVSERWLGEGVVDERFHAEIRDAHRRRVDDVVDHLHKQVMGSGVVQRNVEDNFTTPPSSPSSNTSVTPRGSSPPRHLHPGEPLMSAEAQICDLIQHANHAIRQLRPPLLARGPDDIDIWQMSGEDRPTTGATVRAINHAGSGPRLRKAQRTNLQVDAMATLMLCLPATLNELVFEAGTPNRDDQPWYDFASFLIDGVMQIFGHRLESLAMASGGTNRRARSRTWVSSAPDPEITSITSAAHLTALRRLVLASTSVTPEGGTVGAPGNLLHLDTSDRLECWTQPSLHTTLTDLEIRHSIFYDDDFDPFVVFAKPFCNLRRLAFRHISYNTRGLPSRIYPSPTNPTLGPGVLLAFAIALRRALPASTEITFHHITHSTRGVSKELPVSALTWLMREAVSANHGVEIDFQREERLQEDFESFQGLWEAEDGVEGEAARVHRREVDLVDKAMCSRWKQFENVRRDGTVE
ncbi:hypothetical protein B0A54_10862 [Friedmanniomyces endolithicus]|uniref:Uncharacterized protein n=1 Tax=Friedmanniomyces endolithicus TaxID=329885 RepID=A0A4U0UYA2_9PEZI|nr:hypothetical protein LTS09_007435 [Friedmanniomyces endolithicus]TKA40256.1 hypothetical protein B0A54_10862 [Friedmanniomyces endolithicus]